LKRTLLPILLITLMLIVGCSNKQTPDTTSPSNIEPSSDSVSDSSSPDVPSSDSPGDSSELEEPSLGNEETPVNEPVSSNSSSQKPQVDTTTDIFQIKEKMFIAQCNDIYLNPEDYKNKTIKLEGIYDEYTDPDTNKTYYYVIRYGPGCCGNDGVAGFEILYDGDFPKLNDWIEVMGKIEFIKEDDAEYVALRLSKLTVLDVRGAETVSN